MPVAKPVKLVVPSDLRLVDLVHEASQKMGEVAGFDPEEALNLGLAVREATINAMKHGNALDVSKSVEIVMDMRDDGFRAKIRDQGRGFDPETTPDPTSGDNVLSTSGRGLLMIRAFVDEVEFRNRKTRGMEVTLVKKLRPTGRAAERGS